MRRFRQGDLLFIQLSRPPERASSHLGGFTLARGEATGHAHQVDPNALQGVEVFIDTSDRLIIVVCVGAATRIVHEEHSAIDLTEGWWEVRRQREYVPRSEEEWRDAHERQVED